MRSKKKLIAAASSVCFAAMMSLTAYASGDVAGGGDKHLTTAKSQVVSVVNNVVFPVIDVILAVLLFVKITLHTWIIANTVSLNGRRSLSFSAV